jgi:regulator of sigma E protease
MQTFAMIGQFLLALSILVGLHEFGHFAAAKFFKIRVNKFYIFFDFLFPIPTIMNFALAKKQIGETEYGLGWFPMGGYVQIDGMMDETQDASTLASEPKPWEFRSKPAWQRLIVMLGGIIVNVILGVIIFVSLSFLNGKTYLPASEVNKLGVASYELGQAIGIQNGDKILKVNGRTIEDFGDVKSSEAILGQNSYYTIERNGKEMDIQIPSNLIEKLTDKKGLNAFVEPIYTSYEIAQIDSTVPKPSFIKSFIRKLIYNEVAKDSVPPAYQAGLKLGDKIVSINGKPITYYYEVKQELRKNSNKNVSIVITRGGKQDTLNMPVSYEGRIGIAVSYKEDQFKTKHIDYNFGEAISEGSKMAFSVITDNIKAFKKIGNGDVSFSKSVSGPVGIAKMFGADWTRFWTLVGMLSMVLAFMNLLPIPVLDGGHVLFLLYEMIRGKAAPLKFQEVAMTIGTYLVLGLMVFSLANDIFK